MFPVNCPKCSRKSFYAVITVCLHCGIVESRTAASDNFNTTEVEAPRKFETASVSKSHVHPKDTHMDEMVPTNIRKRYKADEAMITENSENKKRCRSEIDEVLGYILPTSNEHFEMNGDLSSEISHNEFPISCLNDIYREIPNTNELDPHNQVKTDRVNLMETIQQNSASNFDSFQTTEKENVWRNVSHFGASQREGIHSIDNFHAVPGPSGLYGNKNMPNLSEEKFPTRFSLERQSAVEIHKANSLCAICRWEMDKHCFEDQGKYLYKCCRCGNVFSRTYEMQKHTTIHRSDFLPCNICGELIFDKDAHDSEETCNVCQEKFQCRTVLEQHILVHKDYYDSNCRVCGTEIDDHLDPALKCYNCCHCKYSNSGRSYFQNHLHIHTGLKVFKCHVCGRRFAQKGRLIKHLHLHFRCKICGNSFISNERLEIHFKKEHTLKLV